ncbi:hypothetical protein TIFTF001_036134 [Ficus carica]|nr:hypothetical protein TIFTF001_036134 [Ficus carica]
MNVKVYVCMASKLPRVVPIRARSGLVHDLGTQLPPYVGGRLGRYITPPATGGVPSRRSTKNGVDYVLWSRLVRLIIRPLVAPSTWGWSVTRFSRGDNSFHELPQVAIANQRLDLVSELNTFFSLVTHVLVEVAIFVRVPPRLIRPDGPRVPKQSFARHLV